MCGCSSNTNCTSSGCNSSCGQPLTYVNVQGVKGDQGENLIFNDYNTGGTVVAASYTQVAGSTYSIVRDSMEDGDIARYITEVTNSGSTAVSRYIQIKIADTWMFTSASPDTLSEITLASGVKRAVIELEIIKTSNVTIDCMLKVEKFNTSNALTSTDVYYFKNIDLTSVSIDMSVSNLEISSYYKGDATNGLTHLKTKVLQYNQQ